MTAPEEAPGDHGGGADEAPDPLLSIGVFARRSRLSMKALRLYDRLGLLTPAYVDPVNGYRRYRESQLFTARLIVLLRRIDMPLDQVAGIVSAGGTAGVDLLTSYWDEVEARIASQREMVALIRTGLLGGDGRLRRFEIRQRDVPEQLVLTEQRHLEIAELDPWVTATKSRLTAAAQECGGPAGRLFVVFHGEINEDGDGPVEVCVPVAHPPVVGSDRAVRREPAHREAYVTVTKAQFEMPQILSAYDAVERWIDAQGVTCAGSPREVYLTGVDPRTAGPAAEICDVAFPVKDS